MLALAASLLLLPTIAVQPVEAGKGRCTNWSSITNPPETIKVYRVNEGFVETVDFKHYVMNVTAREWNVDQRQLRYSGALAVKQYAWYHVLHYRGGKFNGKCFDVRDTTADQLFANKPANQIPRRVRNAVNKTWDWHLHRDGKLPMTGYRRGENVACGANGGYRLMVRSARKCAKQGWSAERILEKYFTATLKGAGAD
jgi:peptidoglycan hydrolase-like amidase